MDLYIALFCAEFNLKKVSSHTVGAVCLSLRRGRQGVRHRGICLMAVRNLWQQPKAI